MMQTKCRTSEYKSLVPCQVDLAQAIARSREDQVTGMQVIDLLPLYSSNYPEERLDTVRGL